MPASHFDYAEGDRVRFRTEHVLAVQDLSGTVKQTWPDGCLRVRWDDGQESYVEAVHHRMIEKAP